jgi:putative ABC transport system permease protein
MNTVETFKIALGALSTNKTRSGLAALGVIVGVAAVVCVISIGAGAQAEVAEKIRTLGANLLVVVPEARNASGVRLEAGTQPTLTEDDASTIRHELQDVQVAAPLLTASKRVIAGDRNWMTLIAGIGGDYLIAREWRIANGRSFTTGEVEAGAKVAIVGSVIEQELFEGYSSVGQTMRIGDVPFTIIGVLENKGLGAAGISQDDVVFIPLAAAKSRVLGAVRGGSREALDSILVKVSDGAAMSEVKSGIDEALRRRHHILRDAPDDFRIDDPAAVLSTREAAAGTLNELLIAIASVSLVVGGISIMNIMIVSVIERTREIGLRIAVGARRSDIRMQFLIEAATLAFPGGLVGALLGAIAAAGIALNAGWPVLINPSAIALACGFAVATGLLFGLYPACRAAQLEPVVALRFE